MKYIIHEVRVNVLEYEPDLKKQAAKRLRTSKDNIIYVKIIKQSVDARRKDVFFVFSLLVKTRLKIMVQNDIKEFKENILPDIITGEEKLSSNPVIIGSGPCGLFCALVLAKYGYEPIVLERGSCIKDRIKKVNEYWESGTLNLDTNVQFGEGGAGTFSDGKLTTRISDARCETILKEFAENGAPDNITYLSKPHIGSDVLVKIIENLREKIISLGGTFYFNTKAEELIIQKGKVTGVKISNGSMAAGCVIAAIGHSARDTYYSFFNKGIIFKPKPFSIGVRIEHPQELIDRAMYKNAAGHPLLGPAAYQMHVKTGKRTAYTFCMCPGGIVVASASETDTIVTNGMSLSKRDGKNANSAYVVSVEPKDYNNGPLGGIEFQRKWERLAFAAGNSTNAAPVQRLEDFILKRASKKMGSIKPSYTGMVYPSNINNCLPYFICEGIRNTVDIFNKKISGFNMPDAVLTGVETRTSAPVRIVRDENMQAVNVKGLYPAGEGAGYAGGIMSAAADGIKAAEKIIQRYSPLS